MEENNNDEVNLEDINIESDLPQEDKQSKKKPLIIIAAVAVLVAILAGYFLLMSSDDEPGIEPVTSTNSAEEEQLDIYAKLKEFSDNTKADNPDFNDPVQNDGFVYVEDEEGGDVFVVRQDNSAYRLEIEADELSRDATFAAAKTFESSLEGIGLALKYGKSFSQADPDPELAIDNPGIAVYENETYLCLLSADYTNLYAGCVLKDSVQPSIDAMKPFYEAYEIEEGSNSSGTVVDIDLGDINSPVPGYERVTGTVAGISKASEGIYTTVGGGFAKFYRPVDGEWQFFTGGNGIVECSELNATEIESQVFSDFTCIDEALGEQATLEEYSN